MRDQQGCPSHNNCCIFPTDLSEDERRTLDLFDRVHVVLGVRDRVNAGAQDGVGYGLMEWPAREKANGYHGAVYQHKPPMRTHNWSYGHFGSIANVTDYM